MMYITEIIALAGVILYFYWRNAMPGKIYIIGIIFLVAVKSYLWWQA